MFVWVFQPPSASLSGLTICVGNCKGSIRLAWCLVWCMFFFVWCLNAIRTIWEVSHWPHAKPCQKDALNLRYKLKKEELSGSAAMIFLRSHHVPTCYLYVFYFETGFGNHCCKFDACARRHKCICVRCRISDCFFLASFVAKQLCVNQERERLDFHGLAGDVRQENGSILAVTHNGIDNVDAYKLLVMQGPARAKIGWKCRRTGRGGWTLWKWKGKWRRWRRRRKKHQQKTHGHDGHDNDND